MLKDIEQSSHAIIVYFDQNQYQDDHQRTKLTGIISDLQKHIDSVPNIYQINDQESLINYLYYQLNRVREVNHKVQLMNVESTPRPHRKTIIPNHLFGILYFDFPIIDIQFTNNHQQLEEVLARVERNQKHIQVKEFPQPKRSYTLEKIVNLWDFEVACLKSHQITPQLMAQLRAIEEDPITIHIVDIIHTKVELVNLLRFQVKLCQQLLLMDFSDVTQQKQKVHDSFIKTHSQSSTLISLHYNDKPNVPQKQSIKPEEEIKSCQCILF